MNSRKKAMEYRLAQWTQIIQEHQERGLSIKSRKRDKRDAFYFWRKKIMIASFLDSENNAGGIDTVPNGWVRLLPGQFQLHKMKSYVKSKSAIVVSPSIPKLILNC